ncbi:MAG: hypothetical protein ACPGVT_14210 [Maricaulaceae bacterium]
MTIKPPKPAGKSKPKLSREERLAENLRMNLRRRKQAARKTPSQEKE